MFPARLRLARPLLPWLAALALAVPAVLASAPAAVAADYRLGSDDAIEVRVEGEPTLSGTFKISKEGRIVYPLLGELNARGSTVTELAEHLRTALAKDYLKEPQLAVFVAEYASQKVLILGEVDKPGFYVIRGDSTLLSVLSEAGCRLKEPTAQIVITRAGDEQGPDAEPAGPAATSLADVFSQALGALPPPGAAANPGQGLDAEALEPQYAEATSPSQQEQLSLLRQGVAANQELLELAKGSGIKVDAPDAAWGE